MAETKICPKCGAVYQLSQHKIIMRDKDSIICHTPGCGETIIKWNGAVWYTEKLVKQGTVQKT